MHTIREADSGESARPRPSRNAFDGMTKVKALEELLRKDQVERDMPHAHRPFLAWLREVLAAGD